MLLLAFKFTQILVLAAFGLLISDHRARPESRPVMPRPCIVAMKSCYLVPIIAYGYVLWTMDSVRPLDFAALTLTIIGTSLIWRAKIDLGESHAWTGYFRSGTRLVRSGIYSWVRHPLYLGIGVVIAGSLLTILSHGSELVAGAVIVFVSGVLVFVTIAARREHLALAAEFGQQYRNYCNRVHSCLPLRRFQEQRRPPN